MMQNGLHIGLAAWINQQRQTDSFAVYPSLPLVTALVDLAAIQNVHDVVKASEFSRLVNFIPRQGQVADTFSSSAVLWQVHRDLLRQMDFATEPWSSSEQTQFQAARDVLYTTDDEGRPSPSQKLLFYEEMRNAYQDLSHSGGTPEELSQALGDWVFRGYKQAIEDALEVIGRLMARSTRQRAQQEALLLNDVPPGTGLQLFNDLEFAPTYFAPISAMARDTWLRAKVTFAELDRAVTKNPATTDWNTFFANRVGEVTFDFVVLTCIRPWYTPALYQADDWRLRSSDTVASQGNNSDGVMPAYVDAVYLVSVQNVTIQPVSPPRPRLEPIPGKLDPFPLPRPRPVPLRERVKLTELTIVSKSPDDTAPRKGVVARTTNTALIRGSQSPAEDIFAERRLLADEVPDLAVANRVTVKSGQIRKLSTINLNHRFSVAQAFVDMTLLLPPSQAENATSNEIYVAGFGCKKIPFAPNPNANYHW